MPIRTFQFNNEPLASGLFIQGMARATRKRQSFCHFPGCGASQAHVLQSADPGTSTYSLQPTSRFSKHLSSCSPLASRRPPSLTTLGRRNSVSGLDPSQSYLLRCLSY